MLGRWCCRSIVRHREDQYLTSVCRCCCCCTGESVGREDGEKGAASLERGERERVFPVIQGLPSSLQELEGDGGHLISIPSPLFHPWVTALAEHVVGVS